MKYIVCDIDGTIADCKHRLHFLKKRDWDSFYEACDKDTPIQPVVQMVKHLWPYYVFIFLTGRKESVREKTVIWINKFVALPVEGLITDSSAYYLLMRPDGDYRHDIQVKPELLAEFPHIVPEDIAFILEDRDSMVRKWRAMGFTCLQTAQGDF
jgi:hypothetical protein